MGDLSSYLVWQKFNTYEFHEKNHTYFYNGRKVKYSVTQFTSKFYEKFDKDKLSLLTANKLGVTQEEVLSDWENNGKSASIAGTLVHSYLENLKRGKVVEIDYSLIYNSGMPDKYIQLTMDKLNNILPQARKFHEDTLNRLFPIQLEYTVGIEDFIAGNIDLLCYNKKADEFQIWDYKNTKEFTCTNKFNKYLKGEFYAYSESHLNKYSIQLNMYKAIIQRVLNIPIGKCYLVHFNCEQSVPFNIYECIDMQTECSKELDKLIGGVYDE